MKSQRTSAPRSCRCSFFIIPDGQTCGHDAAGTDRKMVFCKVYLMKLGRVVGLYVLVSTGVMAIESEILLNSGDGKYIRS